MNDGKAIASSLVALGSAAVLAAAAQDRDGAAAEERAELRSAADASWITLSGTVRNSRAESFELDYGGGTITV